MARNKNRVSQAAKAKEKKEKIALVVGGLILVGLLAFQGPKILKRLHHSTPPAPAAATSPAPSSAGTSAPVTGAIPTASAAAPTGPVTLTSGDATPTVGNGQLASFSLFASKDPFAQQLAPACNSSEPQTCATPSTPGSTTSGSGSSGSSGTGGTTTAPAPGSAVISVNGTLMTVTVGGDFPQPSASDPSAQPLFHLVSLTAHTAKVSIVGGSYTNGAPTATLRENHPVTLMNTADGTRYKLVLRPQGTSVPSQTTTTPTTTTTTTTAPSP